MDKEHLYIKIEGRLATVEFGYAAANALTKRLLERLIEGFEQLSDNPEVAVVALKSEGGKAFCGGAALDELLELKTEAAAVDFFEKIARCLLSMSRCRQVIVARVQGKAVGGGLGLLAACDYAYAVEAASAKLSELGIGLAPMVIEPFVKAKIGMARFMGMALSPTEWKSAYKVQEAGLYHKVFETAKEMDTDLDFFLKRLCEYPPEALQAIKQAAWEGFRPREADLLERAKRSARLSVSPFCREALRAYK